MYFAQINFLQRARAAMYINKHTPGSTLTLHTKLIQVKLRIGCCHDTGGKSCF